MSRNIATTRHHRRVVWLFVIGIIGIGLFSWLFSTIWLTRDTISASSPISTIAVIRFTPNRWNWPEIHSALKNLTLVSNRSLTTLDIRSFTEGEFALFFMEDGSRALGIRTHEAKIPHDTLDAQGIVVQKTGTSQYLFSDRLLATSNTKVRHRFRFPFGWPLTKTIGTTRLVGGDDKEQDGTVRITKNGIELVLPKTDLPRIPWNVLPTDVFAVLATPVLPNTDISGVTGPMDNLLNWLDTPSASSMAKTASEHPGTILLSSDEQGIGFLLELFGKDFDRVHAEKLLRTASAIDNPKTTAWELTDHTTVSELSVDPSSVSIEEITVHGTQVLRVKSIRDTFLYAAVTGNGTILTNRENLLGFALNTGEQIEIRRICGKPTVQVNVRKLLEVSSAQLNAYTTGVIEAIASNFSVIQVNRGLFHTTISLCNDCCG